jgi:hypothetical protein
MRARCGTRDCCCDSAACEQVMLAKAQHELRIEVAQLDADFGRHLCTSQRKLLNSHGLSLVDRSQAVSVEGRLP